MKVALVHTYFKQSHLDEVVEKMRALGPPTIRAIWIPEREVWAALEGCHRLRAAAILRMEPVITPVQYTPGMKWAECGMGHDYIAGSITIDEVVKQAIAGTEYTIGLGVDRLPDRDEVRKPNPGEVMKYRIIEPINFDFGGRVIGGVGREFTTEDALGKDMTDYVSQGFLVIVEDEPRPEKETVEATKEVVPAPAANRAARRRGK